MLYIISQNGLRITDLHAISVVVPEHDREDDGVYKVFVNGSEFARYNDIAFIQKIMGQIKEQIHSGRDAFIVLPKDGLCDYGGINENKEDIL